MAREQKMLPRVLVIDRRKTNQPSDHSYDALDDGSDVRTTARRKRYSGDDITATRGERTVEGVGRDKTLESRGCNEPSSRRKSLRCESDLSNDEDMESVRVRRRTYRAVDRERSPSPPGASDTDESHTDERGSKRVSRRTAREKVSIKTGGRRKRTPSLDKLDVRKDIKPNKFSGKNCVETFLTQFEICASHNRWSASERAAQLKCCLVEDAGQLIWDSGSPEDITYRDLVEKLRRRYGSLDQQERYKAQLRARRRNVGEPLAKVYQDIRGMMTRAYPGQATTDMGEQMARDHFLSALNDKDFELKIRERFPNTLDEAFKQAVQFEALKETVDCGSGRDLVHTKNRAHRDEGLARRVAQLEQKTTASTAENQPNHRETEMVELRRKMDEMSRELGRLQALQPQRNYRERRESEQQTPLQNQNPPNGSPWMNGNQRQQQSRQPSSNACFNCGVSGHFARECPETRAKQRPPRLTDAAQNDNVQPADGRVLGTSVRVQNQRERKTYIRLNVNGVLRKVLLDTGSDVTLLPSSAVHGVRMEECRTKLLAANGTPIRVNGRISVEAFVGNHRFVINGLVTDHVSEIMLGFDHLKEHGAIWNFRKDQIELDGVVHKLCGRDGPNWCRRVVLQSDCVVPSRSEVELPTKVVFNDLTRPRPERGARWITEAQTLDCGLRISRTILPDGDVDIPVRAINTLPNPITLQGGTVISKLEAVEVCETDEGLPQSNLTESDPVIAELVSKVDQSLTAADRSKLASLLREFSHTFSRGENDLGRTDVVTHNIDTGNSGPVRQSLRRHPPLHQEAITQHVQSMLEQGVIEPSKSPFASNVVLVKKKDGSLRCCIDYRQLNGITKKDAYPLPRTDVCLDAMHGSRWFSTFDLRSSYHQVLVDERDRDKTAFICREGQFRFRTMPFGLCNAGATFQRLMDVVMSGLSFEVCLSYLDDVIVYSETSESHFERLRLVLDRFSKAGLKLKPSKCCIFQKSVEFLGHVISEGNIGVNPKKIMDVVDWPVPTSVKEVRGFIGLCSYYRRFVKDFGKIAAPLNALSEKNCVFSWQDECQLAFDKLKELLTTTPLLAMPNDTDTFVLDTDASQYAIGAVLSQIQEGVERPVAYASRKLSKAEVNYCVTRKELLAIVNFLKYFRHYLLGRRFHVRTDHAALQWLRHIPEPVGQQARWIGFMEEFNFDILHRPGLRHGNADAMSRRPCRKKDCLCSTTEGGELCESCTGYGAIRVVKQHIGLEPIVPSVCQRTQIDDSRFVQTPTSLANMETEDDVRAVKQGTDYATSLLVAVGSMNVVRDVNLNPRYQVCSLESIGLESLKQAPDPPVPPDGVEMVGTQCNGRGIAGIRKHYNGVRAVAVNDTYYGDGRVGVQHVVPVPSSVFPREEKVLAGEEQCFEEVMRQQNDKVIAVSDTATSAGVITRQHNGLGATVVRDVNDDHNVAWDDTQTSTANSIDLSVPPEGDKALMLDANIITVTDVGSGTLNACEDITEAEGYGSGVTIEGVGGAEALDVRPTIRSGEAQVPTGEAERQQVSGAITDVIGSCFGVQGDRQSAGNGCIQESSEAMTVPGNSVVVDDTLLLKRRDGESSSSEESFTADVRMPHENSTETRSDFTGGTPSSDLYLASEQEMYSHVFPNMYGFTTVQSRSLSPGLVRRQCNGDVAMTVNDTSVKFPSVSVSNVVRVAQEKSGVAGLCHFLPDVSRIRPQQTADPHGGVRCCLHDECAEPAGDETDNESGSDEDSLEGTSNCEVRAVEADVRDANVILQQDALSQELIASQQRTDDDIRHIIELLEEHRGKPSWDDIASKSSTTKALWQQWERLSMRNGALYRRFETLPGKSFVWQLIIPFQLRKEVFDLIHEGVTGGHMGRRRTGIQLQRRAYWPGWTEDVRRFIRTCTPCAQYHRGGPPKKSTLKPFVAGDVWEVVSIDVTGPHPRSKHGNIYMLTIMDHFSKWADAFPIPNHTATTIARILFNRVFVYLGMPVRLLTDQGPEFESNMFSELCRWMGIQKLRTTPYKPSTNGMVERYHRTLNSILAKLISSNQRDWCEQAPTAAAAYRASVHESTGFSPNFVVFGRENRMPADLVLGCPPNEEEYHSSPDQYVNQLQMKARETFASVRLHLGYAANRRKSYYDAKVKQTEVVVGQWVWYLYPRRRVGLSPKWQRIYTGPYLIVRIISPNNVVLQKSRRAKQFVVHKDKVKPFNGEPPLSWLRLEREPPDEPDVTSIVNDEVNLLADNSSQPPHQDELMMHNVPKTENLTRQDDVEEGNYGIQCEGDGRRIHGEGNRSPLPDCSVPFSLTTDEGGAVLPNSTDHTTVGISDSTLKTSHPKQGQILESRENNEMWLLTRSKRKPTYLNDYVCRVCVGSMAERGRAPHRCSLTCPVCAEPLSRSDALARHIRKKHGSSSLVTASDDESVTGSASSLPTGQGADAHRQWATSTAVSGSVESNAHQQRVSTIMNPGKKPPADHKLVEAAALVMAAGPAASVAQMARELQGVPLFLEPDVARAIAVAARFAACDIATRKESISLPSVTSGATYFISTQATLARWAREPNYETRFTTESNKHLSPAPQPAGVKHSGDCDRSELKVPCSSGQNPKGNVNPAPIEDASLVTPVTDYPESVTSRQAAMIINVLEETKSVEQGASGLGEVDLIDTTFDSALLASSGTGTSTPKVQIVESKSPLRSDVGKSKHKARKRRREEYEEKYQEQQAKISQMEAAISALTNANKPTRDSGNTPALQVDHKPEGSVEPMETVHMDPLVIHNSREKDTWEFRSASSTPVLILADSNFRLARRIPANWQVHVYPGARFNHILSAVERSRFAFDKKIDAIYVQVGINHRHDNKIPRETFHDLLVGLRGIAKKVIFVAISVGACLDRRSTENVKEINYMARTTCDGWIAPLPTADVRIQNDDRDGIHHTSPTVGAIFEKILKYHRDG